MDIHFKCTQCGKCCQDLRLPLTITEARRWFAAGRDLQLLCEATPWPTEPAPDNLQALHWRRRSFAGMNGMLPARVTVILTANLAGRCPELQADMRCGIYEHRPYICRIYPAEVNPFRRLDIKAKLCPPEAWDPKNPLFQTGGATLPDPDLQDAILRSREADFVDAPVKQRLSAALGLDRAAVSGEGFVMYSPDRNELAQAFERADESAGDDQQPPRWRFVSKRPRTLAALETVGGICEAPQMSAGPPYEYLDLGGT
jgi:Fe-S-cluster containining protein